MNDRFREAGLEDYFSEISRYKLLTRDEEMALARRVQAGDPKARAALVNANLRLVVSIARRFVGRGHALMDLIEEGNVGLVKAADLFDPDQGCRFATYATWWIKQAIRRSLADTAKPVRIPSYLHPKIAAWRRKAREIAAAERGREPSVGEVARACGVLEHDLPIMRSALLTLSSLQRIVSLDQELRNEGPLRGTIAGPRELDPATLASERADKNRLAELLDEMPPRSVEILSMRFGLDGREPRTLREVGEAIHLSRERVRQIEAEALSTLRELFERDGLPVG